MILKLECRICSDVRAIKIQKQSQIIKTSISDFLFQSELRRLLSRRLQSRELYLVRPISDRGTLPMAGLKSFWMR